MNQTNQTAQNDFKALITRLNDLAYKPMSSAQMIDLAKVFARIGYKRSEMIVKDIEHLEKIPANVYAAADNAATEILETEHKNVYLKEYWTAQDLCTTPEEFGLYFRITGLIIKLHADGTVKTNGQETVCTGPDIDTWIHMGRPKTWSPLVDKFLTGYEKVYKNEKASLEFMNRFYQFLRDNYMSKSLESKTNEQIN